MICTFYRFSPMTDEPLLPQTNPHRVERPWQFSLLHLFGLTTVVSVCAAAFHWGRTTGMEVTILILLTIATIFRTRAVVRTAAPSLRKRSLLSLIGFGVITSFVSSLAALVAFCVTCGAVQMIALVAPWGAELFLGIGCVLGSIAGSVVLYRSWPSRPTSK